MTVKEQKRPWYGQHDVNGPLDFACSALVDSLGQGVVLARPATHHAQSRLGTILDSKL
jgi:hypothetical protein